MGERATRFGPTSFYVCGKFTIVTAKLDGTVYVLDTETDSVHRVFANTSEAISYVENYREVTNG
jgi:hypothetical protein